MDLHNLIFSSLGDSGLGELSNLLTQENTKTKDAVSTSLGFMFGGLGKNISSNEGAKSLAKAAEEHNPALLENLTEELSQKTINTDDGAKILKHIFAEKTPTIENTISKNLDVSQDKVWTLMKTLAPVVLSAIKPTKTSEGSLDIASLANILLWSKNSATKNSSLANDIFSTVLSGEAISDGNMFGFLKRIFAKLG